MRHLDEGTIHAWLDGALSPDEAARAEAHVASCSSCADAVAEARGLIAASSRILTALDDVPGGVVPRAQRAESRPRLFVGWLVRERIAAVVALVVAGGALAMVLSRDTPSAALSPLASAPVQMTELAAADSPTPTVAVPDVRNAGQTAGAVLGRGGRSRSPGRDIATPRQADSAPLAVLDSAAHLVPTGVAAAAPVLPTDDTLRRIEVAQAQREEAQELLAEAKPSLAEKLRVLPRRNAAPEAAARFAEPRAAEPSAKGALGAALGTGVARLVQEERMTEGGREVRRRIYSIDEILVTLDERLPDPVDEVRRARVEGYAAAAAPPVRQDSTQNSTNTIRWTDARGAELTLTGPASQARLERIRKLLGY